MSGMHLRAVVVLLLMPSLVEAVPLYNLIDLGRLPGGNFAQARAINDFGVIVGESRDGMTGNFRATLFGPTGGGANIDLGTLGGENSIAFDVNSLGVIVGRADLASGLRRATRFDASGGGANVDLGALPGGMESSAQAVSDGNVIVGEASVEPPFVGQAESHATRFDFSGGANIDLNPVTDRNSVAWGIHETGGIVGEISYRIDVNFFAVDATRFDPSGGGANADLGHLGGSGYGVAYDVNAAGTIVGEGIATTPFGAATRFDPAGPEIDLGTVHGWESSIALGINDAGVIVGSSHQAMTNLRSAVLFDPTGGGANYDLNELVDPADPLFGVLHMRLAYDINNAGWIVGAGEHAQNGFTAFLLVPVPEAESVILYLLAVLLMICGRRAAASSRPASGARLGAVLILVITVHVARPSPAAAQGVTEIIAMTNSAAPDGNGFFATFTNPVLNNAGQAAFHAVLTGTSGGANDDRAIYLGAGGPLTQIAREKLGSPVGGPGLSDLGLPSLNNVGQVAFRAVQLPATGGQFEGVFRGSGGPLTTIARQGNPAPDGNGTFLDFNLPPPTLNDAGQVAFMGFLTGTSDNEGIFRGDGGAVTQIARTGQPAPDGNGTFDDFFFGYQPTLNASGQTAFLAKLTGTSDNEGIFLGAGGAITQIVRVGQAAPDGNGSFSDISGNTAFLAPALNDSGQAAFSATLSGANRTGNFLGAGGAVTQIARAGDVAPDGNGALDLLFSMNLDISLNASGQAAFAATLASTSGGESDDLGIFRGSGGAVTQMVRAGQSAPNGNGAYIHFGISGFALNAAGEVAFEAGLSGTSGGESDDVGVFLANGIDILQVARKGDQLGFSTITDLRINASGHDNGDEQSGINDSDQVAYWAELSSTRQAIVRFTLNRDVHWTSAGSGFWTTNGNWSGGVAPNSFHNTFLDSAADVEVFAPGGTKYVRSLSVGGGGGRATLSLTPGAIFGVLNGPLSVAGGGVLTGGGLVDATLLNTAGGEVIAPAGQQMTIAGGESQNFGRVTLTGGSLHFKQDFINNGGALVIGNGTLRADGGLLNHGTMAFSATTNVVGDVTIAATGLVATGGGATTFFDDVLNQGEVRTSAGSHTVFFGALAGGGSFTGTGSVVIESDFTPGASAAAIALAGDVILGPAATLHAELGGLSPGSQFDQLDVAGDVELAGSLAVSLINGFTLSAGDSFEIIDVDGVRSGTFTGLTEGALVDTLLGVELLISYAGGDGNDVVLFAAAPLLPGDYNNNGVVDAADYTTWRDNLGAPAGTLPNDADGGPIGPAQYATWKANFGNTAGSGSGALHADAVPEPALVGLLLLAIVSMLTIRRADFPLARNRAMRAGVALSWTGLACVFSHLSPAAAQGLNNVAVVTGDPAPDGNGTFLSFGVPVLNNAIPAQAAFSATLTGTSDGGSDDSGIFVGAGGLVTQFAREKLAGVGSPGLTDFGEPAVNDSGEIAFTAVQSFLIGGGVFDSVLRGSGGPLTTIAREGNAAPDGNGEFLSFGPPALNDAGQLAFLANLTGTIFGASDDTGIYRGNGGPITQIAHERYAAPDLNGTFSIFGAPAMNSSDEVAFWAELMATSGGEADNGAIFRGSGGQLDQIVREGQTVPGGNGTFAALEFGAAAIDDSGRVAFKSFLAGTSGGSADNEGIFLSSGGPFGPPLTQIVRKGQTAPGGNGTFFSLAPSPLLNDFGQIAFFAFLTDTGGGTSDDSGIFLGAPGGPVTQMVREGQTAPDGNGTFSTFGNVALNRRGVVAFVASLSNTDGGPTDDVGIFLTNGIDVLEVNRKGNGLDGSNITQLAFNVDPQPSGDGRSGLNNADQVIYWAELDNGEEAIVRFTVPDLHWTAPGDGSWHLAVNWLLSIVPSSFNHTFIDPESNVTVTADSLNSIVRSLTVGATVSGQAVLELTGIGELAALESITINTRGQIEFGAGLRLAAPTLTNAGILVGNGQVDADLVNLPTGLVRARPAESMQLNATNSHANAGTIEAFIGAEIEFNGELSNAVTTGQIRGTGATLRFYGGLINDGDVSLTLVSDVHGSVTNTASGTISVENGITGTTLATFHDDVTNGGTLEVMSDSTAVFLDSLSGTGTIGSGEVQALGDLVPGASAGLMAFGGDLTLGPLSRLNIQLGGSMSGEFDRVEVAGDAVLEGVLRASAIDNFVPTPGQEFTVLTAANITDNGLMLGGPLSLSLRMIVDQTSVILLALSGLAGDYNNNGVVDAADYTVWRDHLGAPAGTLPNDVDGGPIGPAQYATWKTNFGNIAGSGGASHLAPGESPGANYAVPEPARLTLFFAGLLAVCTGRWAAVR